MRGLSATMLILPRGVTGFWRRGEAPPAPCDLAAFRRDCFAAAREGGGGVVNGRTLVSNVATSFAQIGIELPAACVDVLLNRHHPLVGFAAPRREGDMLLRFVDGPAIARVFRSFERYTVIDASELATRLTPEMCVSLGPEELHEIKSWRARTVGEVVLNFWD